MHKNKGFTLIEVLVIVGVIAVISAVATPSLLTWRSNAKLRGAAERIRGDLQLAKSRAVREAKTVIVKLKSDKYRIFIDTGDGSGGPANGTYDNAEPIVCERHLPSGIQLIFGTPAKVVDDDAAGEDASESSPPVDDDSALDDFIPPGEGKGGGVGGGLLSAPTGSGNSAVGAVLPPGLSKPKNKDLEPSASELQPIVHQKQLNFDRRGRCLNPQNIIIGNKKGKRRLVAVNTLGNVTVIKID